MTFSAKPKPLPELSDVSHEVADAIRQVSDASEQPVPEDSTAEQLEIDNAIALADEESDGDSN